MSGHPDLEQAHLHSSGHRTEIMASDVCGCFYCVRTFAPEAIRDWVDDVGGQGTTALCPFCGIDSVIGSTSGFPIESEFIERMKTRWF